MGGCYSATKGKKKKNSPAPTPEATELPKELPTEETTLETAKPSKEETTPVRSLPKEVIISEVVTTTSEVSIPLKEECTSEVATKLNDENDVKETKKHKDEVENNDGEKVVVLVDEYKVIEKKTLEEESGPKVDEAEVVASKEDQIDSKCIETKKEDLKVVEEQETEKQSPA